MPNARVLSEKQAIVEALAERIKGAEAGVFVDYRGITVAQDTQLRAELRDNGVEYNVVKNTLARFAVDKVGLNGLDHVLNGTTSLATSATDPILPIRIISEYAKKFGNVFEIKAGFMDGQVLTDEQMAEIAELPSKDALYSKVLGTMLAPITSLAVCLGQILEQKGGSVEPAAEEAPAEA
ncbi:MAG: 50S ribosomal protein L10 [Clostridiales bacterium]|nr:50S ribosomal protein L10 [Clostridiales bacterium]